MKRSFVMRKPVTLMAFVISAFLSPAPSLAAGKVVALPSEPADHPDWVELGNRASRAIIASLKDPNGSEVSWLQGFQWGSMKDVVGGRAYGWVACGYLSRLNQESGAVRKRQISVLAEPSGRIMFDYAGKSHSSCWTRPYVAPNQN